MADVVKYADVFLVGLLAMMAYLWLRHGRVHV